MVQLYMYKWMLWLLQGHQLIFVLDNNHMLEWWVQVFLFVSSHQGKFVAVQVVDAWAGEAGTGLQSYGTIWLQVGERLLSNICPKVMRALGISGAEICECNGQYFLYLCAGVVVDSSWSCGFSVSKRNERMSLL